MRSPLPLAAALMFLAACPQQQRRTYPAPDPQSLLEVVRKRQASLKGVDLETRTTSRLGGQRVRATVLMLVARDGRLRFEAEVSLKGTVAALATDGEHFTFMDMDRNEARIGLACPGNVATLVAIPLPPRAIAAILLGDVPIGPDTTAIAVTWDSDTGAEVLELARPGSSQRYWAHLRRIEADKQFVVIAIEGGTAGAPEKQRWRVSYQDFAPTALGLAPGLIRFAEPGRDFDEGVEITVRDRGLNPDFADGAFNLKIPENFSVQSIACEPDPAQP